eukprot:TRINITY_DN2593_c0_g1_i3.p2 TRINITY_DN2593_c0_g1~~TRINITY_DN2593_c0_g1_i3.p2  ORF type:complete len:118 (+),score=29.09 TRINITY_DN2593_c0_g1_i3:357-710(+)
MAETLRRSVILTTNEHELSLSEREKEVDMISEENLPAIADFLAASPPLEEAGLEDTALPPEGIQEAFERAFASQSRWVSDSANAEDDAAAVPRPTQHDANAANPGEEAVIKCNEREL